MNHEVSCFHLDLWPKGIVHRLEIPSGEKSGSVTLNTDQEYYVGQIIIILFMLSYLWVQIKGNDFKSNKVLNLAGPNVKYSLLN